ncbi:MAG: hypothetical protein KDA86_24630 [Planctomycetaceae bacterium]|nr:hypothetical protein [Planctomycetaceae bacterium]
MSDQRQRQMLNLVGVAGVAFFAIYLIRRIQDGQVASALWACHLASLLTGTGILLRRPTFIGIGVLWLVVGIPLWCVYLAIGGAFRPASLLTHVGGLAVGVLGLKAIGMRSNLWWKAILVLLVLLAISRWLTPPELNVNLAFHFFHELRGSVSDHHALSLAVLTLIASLTFRVAEEGLKRWFPPRSQFANRETLWDNLTA